MADESKTVEKTSELDELAFDIYSRRVAGYPVHLAVESEAINAYRKAEAFLRVKKQIKASGLKAIVPDEQPGADCRAPNLRRTHPLNLISRVDGDLPRAAKIKAWLDRNPTPERDPEEVVSRLNRDLGLDWDLACVNRAREVLPAYCSN